MKLKSLLSFFTWSIAAIIGGGLMAGAGIYLYLTPKLPALQELSDIRMQTPLTVYANDGALIGSFGEQKRIPVEASDIPRDFVNAFLAAEDDRFFEHSGVDFKGLARAVVGLATTGEIQGGGSTITMQVARNIYLHRGQTFTRKFSEILLSFQIEQQLSKDEIFQLYVNKIFLGKRAYGIQAAAEVYYGTTIDQLTLAQMAMIAGLPKGPSIYNPIVNPTRALERRDWILRRMHSLNMISREELDHALAEPMSASTHDTQLDVQAPYIAEMARLFALERFGEDYSTLGYRIYTTVNSNWQSVANTALVNGLNAFDSRKGYRGPEVDASQMLGGQITPEQVEQVIEAQINRVENTPVIGGHVPAVVVGIEANVLTLKLDSNTELTIDFSERLDELRPYIDENQIGRTPSALNEVFVVGDMVRLTPDLDAISQVPEIQGALIAVDSNTGAIRSLVGGYTGDYNRAERAVRQPGSSFKPFIYAAALDSGMTPATLINDSPVVVPDGESIWRPTNDGGRFNGPTRLRQALYQSRNMVSVRIVQELGLNQIRNYLAAMGFNRSELSRTGLSIALGAQGQTPLKMAEVYAMLANGGYRVEPYFIERIEDAYGNIIYQHEGAVVCDTACLAQRESSFNEDALSLDDLIEPASVNDAPRVMDESVNFLLDSILQDVIKRGTGRRARVLERPDIAGKTGTTNGPTDAWFSGYQRNLATVVWVGYDDAERRLGDREYGGSAALPIWIDFMREALVDEPVYQRDVPDGIVAVRINPETGLRTQNRDNSVVEYFRQDNLPEVETVVTEDIFGDTEEPRRRNLDDIF